MRERERGFGEGKKGEMERGKVESVGCGRRGIEGRRGEGGERNGEGLRGSTPLLMFNMAVLYPFKHIS